MCSNVETNLSWTCLVSGLLNFEHPSVLLFCSIKVGCATRSLYASTCLKAERVPTNNQRGRESGPCRLWEGLDKARHIVPTALLVRVQRFKNYLYDLRKFYGRYGDFIKNMRSPSPQCYTTFRMMTTYSDTLLWLDMTLNFDPDLDLITKFDFLPNCEKFP